LKKVKAKGDSRYGPVTVADSTARYLHGSALSHEDPITSAASTMD